MMYFINEDRTKVVLVTNDAEPEVFNRIVETADDPGEKENEYCCNHHSSLNCGESAHFSIPESYEKIERTPFPVDINRIGEKNYNKPKKPIKGY